MTRVIAKVSVVILGLVTTAGPAAAGDFRFRLGVGVGEGGGHGLMVGLGIDTGSCRAVVAVQRVWIPPVYTTVTERVWVPMVQTAYRDVPVVDACGRVIGYRREPYTVNSGYWTQVQRQVLVREGYWTTAGATTYRQPCHPATGGTVCGQPYRAATGGTACRQPDHATAGGTAYRRSCHGGSGTRHYSTQGTAHRASYVRGPQSARRR